MSNPFTVVQKAFIINPRWQVLVMCRGENINIWDLPGGRLEYSESLKDSLVNRVSAETDLKITTVSVPLHLTTFLDPGDRNIQIVRIIYLCVSEGEAKSPHAQDTLKWINANEYQNYKFTDESYSQAFENYLSHSKLASIEFLGPGILSDTLTYLKKTQPG